MMTFDALDEHLLAGRNLIEASAGTGKTYSISLLFLRLILEKKMEPKAILAVTFTNAAVEELRGRIRQFIRDAYEFAKGQEIENDHIKTIVNNQGSMDETTMLLKNALLCFDEAAILTIHGFCQRILTEHSFESGTAFGIELIEDDSFYKRERTADFLRKYLCTMPVELLSYVWNDMKVETMTQLTQVANLSNSIIIPQTEDKSLQSILDELNSISMGFFECFDEAKAVWENRGKESIQRVIQSSKLHTSTKKSYNHAWAQQVDRYFRQRPYALSFNFKKDTFIQKLSQNTVLLKKNSETVSHPLLSLMDQLIDLQNQIKSRVVEIKAAFLRTSPDEIKIRKTASGVQSFDDLIHGIHEALKGPLAASLKHSLRDKYRAVLIDESQDTDPIQFEIFRNIFDDAKTILFFIGDPKQSIYSFRGADIFAYTDVVKSGYVNQQRHFSMDTNFRSTPKLVEAINRLFTRRPNPFLNEAIEVEKVKSRETREEFTENNQASAPLQIWFQFSADLEAHHLSNAGRHSSDIIAKPSAEILFSRKTASEIARLLLPENKVCIGDHAIKAGDIAVLVRTKKQGRLIKSVLEQHQVPAVFSGDSSVFESREALELKAILCAISEPANTRLLKGAWITSLMGGRISDLENKADSEWEAMQFEFRELFDIWLKKGFYPMFRQFVTEHGIKKKLLARQGGERRLTNVLHLAELLNEATQKQEMGGAALLEYLSEKMSETGQSVADYEQRLESDFDAVQITTIHKSKGLEYPVVFCPFLWSNTTIRDQGPLVFHKDHEKRMTAFIGIDPSALSSGDILLANQENLSEALRLMYVAVTRAVHRCYVFWGKIYGMESSAPAYLFHQNYSKDTSETSLYTELKQLEKMNQIDVTRMSEIKPVVLTARVLSESSFAARTFSGKPPYFWRFSSYSGLVKNTPIENEEKPGTDDDLFKSQEESETSLDRTLFTFPRGAKTGIAWHEVLEKFDFTSSVEDTVIESVLKRHGFSEPWMVETTKQMVQNIIHTPLIPGSDDLKLSTISSEQRFSEMEFYFKLEKTTPQKFSAVLEDNFQGLELNTIKGFMKGFIDLVFEKDGKYYIVDWKSNHLGNSQQAYIFPFSSLKAAKAANSTHAILNCMKEHHYILQYYIYCAAVHLYLSQRMQNYDYDRHFGGVFYIFTRGVHQDHDESAGIFRDRPEKKLIESFTSALTGTLH